MPINKYLQKKKIHNKRIFVDILGRKYIIQGGKKIYIKEKHLKNIPKMAITKNVRRGFKGGYRRSAYRAPQTHMKQSILNTYQNLMERQNEQMVSQTKQLQNNKKVILQAKMQKYRSDPDQQQKYEIYRSKYEDVVQQEERGKEKIKELQQQLDTYQKQLLIPQLDENQQKEIEKGIKKTEKEIIKTNKRAIKELDDVSVSNISNQENMQPLNYKELERNIEKKVEEKTQQIQQEERKKLEEESLLNKFIRKYEEMFDRIDGWKISEVEKLNAQRQAYMPLRQKLEKRNVNYLTNAENIYNQLNPENRQKMKDEISKRYNKEKPIVKIGANLIEQKKLIYKQIHPQQFEDWEQKIKQKEQEQQEQQLQDIPEFQQEQEEEKAEGNISKKIDFEQGMTFLQLHELLDKILTCNEQEDWNIMLITKNNEQDQILNFDTSLNNILIFFYQIPNKDVYHFTCCVIYSETHDNFDYKFFYFDPLSNIQRYNNDIDILKKIAQKYHTMIHIKSNIYQKPWQTDDSYCGVYCAIFIQDIICENMKYRDAIMFDQDDQMQLDNIVHKHKFI